MSTSSEEEECSTLDPYTGRTTQEKTQEKYKWAYKNFLDWKTSKNYHLITEDTVLEYLTEMSKKYRPTTLWWTYSTLRSNIKANNDIDIKYYAKVLGFLKKLSIGFISRQCKVFSNQDIDMFLKEAPDDIYLVAKVALIFGISGSCSSNDLVGIFEKDVKEHSKILIVTMKNTRKKIPRSFSIQGEYYTIVKKYMDVRSKKGTCERFFQKYVNGKCVSQPIGRNTFQLIPRKIAMYLGLPDPNEFTGLSFKKTSRSLQVGKRNLNVLSSLDSESQSNTDDEESYIENCKEQLAKLRSKRTEPIDIMPACQPSELLPTSNETSLKHNEVNYSNSHQNNQENSNPETNEKSNIEMNSNPESTNEKSNIEMKLSNDLTYEITLSPLPSNIKKDPEQSPTYENHLSPSSTNNERPNRQNSPCFTFENTTYDNNIIQTLSQTVKMSGKRVTFIFNNCTFTNCFNK